MSVEPESDRGLRILAELLEEAAASKEAERAQREPERVDKR